MMFIGHDVTSFITPQTLDKFKKKRKEKKDEDYCGLDSPYNITRLYGHITYLQWWFDKKMKATQFSPWLELHG